MEPEIVEAAVVPTELPAPAVETPVTVVPPKKFAIPKQALRVAIALAALALAFVAMTTFVYRHAPTDSSVRRIVGVIPYPAAVVGNHVITMKDYLGERDALNTYFAFSAAQSGTPVDEVAITKNVIDTMVRKVAVADMAKAAGITLDEAKANEFFMTALGGADAAAFEEQLTSMFGWTSDEFKIRVVNPVTLASQVGDAILADATRQAPRLAKAQAAYDRIAAGEDFATVAGDTSADASAAAGGDVGEVGPSEIPAEWKDAIAATAVGDYSKPVEGTNVYMIFKVTARAGKDADEKVKLSLISVPKETLDESIQDYLKSTRDWQFIGNT